MQKLITAVITTSPVPSHPSTEFIDQAYDSVRHHLPDIPVLILVDGMRAEQQYMEKQYEEYKKNLIDKYHLKNNTEVWRFNHFAHQAGMMRSILNLEFIQTPLALWVEHDFALLPREIDWKGIVGALMTEEVLSVRFSTDEGGYWTRSQFEREDFTTRSGVPLLKTIEFLSYPNIARLEMYDEFMLCFDVAQTHLETEVRALTERDDWNYFKLSIYNPPNRRRCQHLDARPSSAGLKFPTTR